MTVFFVVIVVAAFAAHRNVLRCGLLTLGNTDDVEILNAVNDVVTGDDFATVNAAKFHFGGDALGTQDGCHDDYRMRWPWLSCQRPVSRRQHGLSGNRTLTCF